ncbi:MAG: threonine--tRNA ligase [Candidatus Liptonbacteria bacterium]
MKKQSSKKSSSQVADLDPLRHSLAHLLAAAVMELYPKTKRAIGPAIENGFYFDFEFEKPISDVDLPKIEKRMREILPTWDRFSKHMLDAKSAKKEYPSNPYKHEMIDEFSEKGKKKISFYKSGSYWDLCRGGHVESMKQIDPRGFKLEKIAGAYWRGDEKNKMLTRIYGLAFNSKKELDECITRLEEAKKRDHRKLGADLDLFTFADLIGKGLPLLTPRGTVIRKELERFIYETETKWGYQHVITPPLARVELYKTSGHYPYFKDTMYPVMQVDEDQLILRPMTCPHHFMLYKSKPHSYRELPMRIAELASQFRYEKSGELAGLMRVRMFCLADAHIITPIDKARDEIRGVLDLIDYVNKVLGLKKGVDYRYRLSLGDRKDSKKYYKDDKAWEKAESVLRAVLKEMKAPFFEAKGEAAFYGPKIDVQLKKVSGQEETAFTVQYDFVMPKRFKLTYVDEGGKEQQPIVVHRSCIGALERTMAFLIERYAGAFPLWLAPVQVAILPVGERFAGYAGKVADALRGKNIRVEVRDANETLGKRIRGAEMEKIPYVLVVGEKEEVANAVNIRHYKKGQLGEMKTEKLAEQIARESQNKDL